MSADDSNTTPRIPSPSSTGAHTSQFNAGGGVDDLWVIEKNAGRYVGSLEQFRADFVASNPVVDGHTLGVQQGQTYHVPERMADGSMTYHYAGGASINLQGNEYHMVVPDGDGGHTVYSRTYVGDVDGIDGGLVAQYEVMQVSTDAFGQETYRFSGQQKGVAGEIVPATVGTGTDSDGNGWLDGWQETVFVADGVVQTRTDLGADGTWDTDFLGMESVSYNLADHYQRTEAEYKLSQRWDQGGLRTDYWHDFTFQSSQQLLGSNTFKVDYGLVPAGNGSGMGGLSWTNPIGAFYDSQSSTHDEAASIAAHLPVVLSEWGVAMSAQQMVALDFDGDGSLSWFEARYLSLWHDLNENGRIDGGEMLNATSANDDRWRRIA